MLAAIALTLAVAPSPSHLTVTPWSGKDLVTTTSAAVKFRLSVNGTPNSTIRLAASNVANGWIAAFCTPKVCAPMRVDVTLPSSGQALYQFELIREEDGAPKQSGATITSDDGSTLTVPNASVH